MKNKITFRRFINNLLIICLLIFIYSQIASRVLFTPIDFDEGYNLQISQHIRGHFLNYATFTGVFDSNITTGPSLLIPAAFFINNHISLFPRLVMLLFSIAFFSLSQIYLYSNLKQKIFFFLLVTLTPLYYYFSSHLLGELPGFVFLFTSLIALSRKHYLSTGGFLALSILTKHVYLFGILAVLTEFIIIHTFSKNRRLTLTHNAAKIISGFLIGVFFWCIYILISVNLSYFQFSQIVKNNWQAMNTLSQPQLSFVDKRIEMLGYVFGINGFLIAIIFMIVCAFVIKKLKQNHVAVSLAFYCLIYTMYYMFMGSTNWYRHFFPAVLAFIVVVPYALDTIISEAIEKYQSRQEIQKGKRTLFPTEFRNIYLILFIIVFLVFNIFQYNSFKAKNDLIKKTVEQNLVFSSESILPLIQPDPMLISQMQTADFINKNIRHNETIAGISWWNAPEIEYLARRKIERDPFPSHVDYVITHYYGEILGFNDYQYLALIQNKRQIYHTRGYTIFKKLRD